MFSKLTTKIALRKAGIPSNALDFDSTSSKGNKASSELVPFANPFTNLEVPKSWKSWATPPPAAVTVAPVPAIGTRAPSNARLRLPANDGRPSVVIFLRHCGCPFAEKTFLEARRLANKFPSLHFVAVSHTSKTATDKWINEIGGAWSIQVLTDEERELYAYWGLGISTTWHLLNPWTQISRQKLGKEEGLWGREVDPSGNRWQVGGAFATDEMGKVKWGKAMNLADDLPNLVEACQSLGLY